MKEIKIMYHNDNPKLDHIGDKNKSNWIDLYTAEDYEIEVGKRYMLSLGVSIKLPSGYEANIVPRSSTFKQFGLLQCNHYGVIDTSYCSDKDVWHMPVYAPIQQEDLINGISELFESFYDKKVDDLKEKTMNELVKNSFTFRKIKIPKGTRLCQFRINKVQEDFKFVESDLSNETTRGGLGSTGI